MAQCPRRIPAGGAGRGDAQDSRLDRPAGETPGKIAFSVNRLNDHLADHEWLAGGMFTLADICNFAIANGMQFGHADIVNGQATPHLLAWIERINARPATQAMFAKSQSEMPPRPAMSAA